jgi:hypothetical protein
MRNSLSLPLLASCLIHLAILLLSSLLIHNTRLHRQDSPPIILVDLFKLETAPIPKIEAVREIKQSTPKGEKPKETKPVIKNEPARIERAPIPAFEPAKEQSAKAPETKTELPTKAEPAATIASSARPEGGGREAGAGNVFGKGDLGVVPGSGTGGGGGGTVA